MDEIEKLIEQLKSKVSDAGAGAAKKLGKIRDKRAVPALIEALNDEDDSLRVEAAEALGYIGDASAVSALIGTLGDEDIHARENAAEALGQIGDASAVPSLVESLKDEEWYVRWCAARALEKIVHKCETIEDFEKVEEGIAKGSAALRKLRIDKGELINLQMDIAKLTRKIAEKKDELTPKKNLLLDDKPKPPKKGRGVYHTTRMIRNG